MSYLSSNACPTINDRLAATGHRPSGFDYMRLILALGVVAWHAIEKSYGWRVEFEVWNTAWRMVFGLIVPMFFALSGFLVAGSLERSKTLVTFLGMRVFRIVPALTGDVILSALILGPVVTSLPLSAYFSDYQFRSYFLNVLGDIHYSLPGVFANNPAGNNVNGQLWTIPYELRCYALLSLLALLGIAKRRSLLLLSLAGFYLFQIWHVIVKPDAVWFTGPPMGGNTLVMIFMTGVVAYSYRDKIPITAALFVLSVALTTGLFMVAGGDRFAAIPATYMTIYLGLLNPPRHKIVLSGDYSYGIYLYGSPIQQTIAWCGTAFQHWYWSLLIGLPVTIAAAAVSWWCIEKPALAQRHILKKLEQLLDPFLRQGVFPPS